MLRRTESIVEKMLTNWLALAMYDYMKDYAGSSLFVLFKAIKFQVSFTSFLYKNSQNPTAHDTKKIIIPPPEWSFINVCFLHP